ncbi:MAG: PIN domain-containing protein [Defluviitaleaceae bacterium]|nr:PIN domain-containing protein [Defluviitaleaceae bacterium]
MLLIDANAILRYILCDNADMADAVEKLLETTEVTVKNEVLAEVVYVLIKVYALPRNEVCGVIEQFLDLENVRAEEKAVVISALETFSRTTLDFVDSLLYAYYAVNRVRVFTFDKKLIKILSTIN